LNKNKKIKQHIKQIYRFIVLKFEIKSNINLLEFYLGL